MCCSDCYLGVKEFVFFFVEQRAARRKVLQSVRIVLEVERYSLQGHQNNFGHLSSRGGEGGGQVGLGALYIDIGQPRAAHLGLVPRSDERAHAREGTEEGSQAPLFPEHERLHHEADLNVQEL